MLSYGSLGLFCFGITGRCDGRRATVEAATSSARRRQFTIRITLPPSLHQLGGDALADGEGRHIFTPAKYGHFSAIRPVTLSERDGARYAPYRVYYRALPVSKYRHFIIDDSAGRISIRR